MSEHTEERINTTVTFWGRTDANKLEKETNQNHDNF
jgi:hypothetical protein